MHNLSTSLTVEPAPTRNAGLIAPFGGTLIDLYEKNESVDDLRFHATTLPRARLTPRNSFDLELIANGAFSPLDRYMGREDYSSVVEDMRLCSGVLFPIPITLCVEHTRNFKLDSEVGLVDERNEVVAVMSVDEIYERDFEREARLVYGTIDTRHPKVTELRKGGRALSTTTRWRVGSWIFDCDRRLLIVFKAKRQSEIGNRQPAIIGPTRYRVLVLTS